MLEGNINNINILLLVLLRRCWHRPPGPIRAILSLPLLLGLLYLQEMIMNFVQWFILDPFTRLNTCDGVCHSDSTGRDRERELGREYGLAGDVILIGALGSEPQFIWPHQLTMLQRRGSLISNASLKKEKKLFMIKAKRREIVYGNQ
jgi:hypothetical protein